MAKTLKNTAKIFGKGISLLLALMILLTMFAGCSSTPKERFEDLRARSFVVTTDGAKFLQEKAISLLKEQDIEVLNSYVSSDFMDGLPYITFVALVAGENGATLKEYAIVTEYDGPIAAAFQKNEEKISPYGDKLYIDSYFEYAAYNLQGDEIIVTE